MQGALAIALSFFLLGGGQQDNTQQQQPSSIPDAPSPSGVQDLKSGVKPGAAATPDSKSGEQTTPPASSPAAAPQAAPGSPDTFQQEAPETPSSAAANQAFVIHVPVNYVDVPVTVRDKHGNLVPGLTWRQFRIYEDGARQRIAYFTVDPYPLSVAFVIDQSLPSDVMKKVNQSLAALPGAFSPADTVAVFTYNSSTEMVSDFTGAQGQRLPIVLARAQKPGRDMGMPITSGPLATGMIINGQIPDPNLAAQRGGGVSFITAPKEIHPLNDAILAAAQALAKQPKGRRRILYVITDGKEARSKASQKEVLRYLLTNNIGVYGTLVGDSATWGIGYLDKLRLPLMPTDNVMPRYALTTGGSIDTELSENAIQMSFSKITEAVRTQYTLGYYSHSPAISGKHHTVDVHVEGLTGLDVTAKEGYYPSMADVTP
ncbi:VWA domain-containing protein [Silvibacterium acidisoli]|uniref:VWA domain-containing protein n=1 Tax=Acidobacteriaceae bacterium ZG23-2 TaxID=2883246 RepID=UPI00406D2D8D